MRYIDWLNNAQNTEARRLTAVIVARHLEDVMDQVIVTLDGKDHKIGYGEHTMCMLPVPHGTTREEGAKECKVCFDSDDKDEPAEEVFAINTGDPQDLGTYENPDADPEPEAAEVTSDGTEPVEADFTEEPEAKPKARAKPAKKATKAK